MKNQKPKLPQGYVRVQDSWLIKDGDLVNMWSSANLNDYTVTVCVGMKPVKALFYIRKICKKS